MLALARWPHADAGANNPAAEARFGLLADLIRQVRNARTEHNVPPSRTVGALVQAAPELADVFGDNLDLLRSLAMLEDVTVRTDPVEPPATAAAVTAEGVTMYVLDIIDPDAEIARLTKQAGTLTRGVEGIQAKLSNEKFRSRAPADVVAREEARLASLQAELAAVEKSLAALKD